MKRDWQLIESGSLSPDAIMMKDAHLLKTLESNGPCLLHLYDWSVPSLTYGYFTQPGRYLQLHALPSLNLQAARRPTGGGIIFHLTDFAFSVLIPARHPSFSLNPLANYAFINAKAKEAIVRMTFHSIDPLFFDQKEEALVKKSRPFCMANPTLYDLIVGGKKVGGAAERRNKNGLLHQGSLSLLFPPLDLLSKALKDGDNIAKAMKENSYCILPEGSSSQDLKSARFLLKEIFKEVFQV